MTKNNNTTRIFLIRHGITDWIEEGLLHGITDRPLSEIGLKQAQEVAGAMKNTTAKWLYSSPLSRAYQTAEAVAKETGLEIEKVDGLCEMDYGWMEGKRDLWPIYKHRKLIVNLYRSARLLSAKISGESESKFKKRVLSNWQKLKTLHPGDDKIVVAHFGVLRLIITHELNDSVKDITKYFINPCSITEFEVNDNAPTKMIRLNDCKHISGDSDL